MRRLTTGILLTACAAGLTFGQAADADARFVAADVRPSAKTQNMFPRTTPPRNGRYEVKTASIADLIMIAYGYTPDKVLGGPSWLELDRFDIVAKLPAESTPESIKPMLQNLLAERFQLVVKKETKPLPAWALTQGKKVLLKEATGSEDLTGCRPQTGSAPQEGGTRLMMSTNGGPTQTFNLGPGATITYQCRNISMKSFAESLRTMMGANLGNLAIVDETGLEGKWNFDLKYSMALIGPSMDTAERIPIGAAIEKQLGLKVEEKPIPTPVIVVVSVNRKPSDNPANISEILPPLPVATSFEVASVKPVEPGAMMMGGMRTQPGGRLVVQGMPLQFIVMRAFNAMSSEAVVGLPPFANQERFDINAKLPAGYSDQMGFDSMAPLILDLLKERFKLQYHTEDREVTTYALTAGKPKLKKADPESRTSCKNVNSPGVPPSTRVFTCQNATMAFFAERLQNMAPGISWPVADQTGLDGSYDFTVSFSARAQVMMAGGPPPPPPPGGGGGGGVVGGMVGGMAGGAPAGGGGSTMPSASDPSGGQTIFEAIEKQLGLKLEKVKKPMPVIVIDHIEQRPTEN